MIRQVRKDLMGSGTSHRYGREIQRPSLLAGLCLFLDSTAVALACAAPTQTPQQDNNLVADGPLPVGSILDQGFYVQTSYMLVPKRIELYGTTPGVFPQIYPPGTKSPHEALDGLNWYSTDSRNYGLNLQVIHVDRSPVNSTFRFYTGALKGTIMGIGATTLF